MREQVPDALVIVPVVLADQHHREVLSREPAGLHEELHGGAVAGFRRVIHGFPVVRVGAPLEQQPRQRRVMRNAGGAVQGRLELGVLSLRPEPGIGIGSGVEQGPGRSQKGIGSRRVEPEVLRETQIGERIAAVGDTLRSDVRRIALEDPAHGRVVAEDRGRVEVAARELRVRDQDLLGAVQGAMPECGLEQGRPEISHFFTGASGPRDRGGPMRRASICSHCGVHVLPPSVERSPVQEKRSGPMA